MLESIKDFFKDNKGVEVVLLMLYVVLRFSSPQLNDLLHCASASSESCMPFSQQLLSFGSQSIEDGFKHDFAALADQAFGTVVQELPKLSLL